ncbi:MAG: asparagine synthetase B [Alphaproteobacteria bacterium]|nr:MAG: asparagine synthetase B [Alphaproteobacteria bacterium]
MSGFAGILTDHGGPPSEAHMAAMARSLRHRGADEDGEYSTGGFAVVHARLATRYFEADEQPLFDAQGAVLVADAEFSVIESDAAHSNPIARYREAGPGFAEHIPGSFSLALYDPTGRTILLARDRFGTRPLYYAELADGFIFASEISALLETGMVSRAIDPEQVDQLLQLQFNCGRKTIYQDVRRVLPGETIIAQNGKVVDRIRREVLPRGGVNRYTQERALTELTNALNHSFDLCLEREEPIGIFFSGDIETAVLLDANHELGRPVPRIFSPSIEGPRGQFDRERTDYYAGQLGVEVNRIEISPQSFWDDTPSIIKAIDDPVADYSILYAFNVAREAASEVKIMLSATGANEIFAGRSRYRRALRPFWLGGRGMYSRGFMEDLGLLREERSGWRDAIGAAQNRINPVVYTRLQQVQGIDMGDWLANNLLTMYDRCYGRHSIEMRYPYLDEQVVDFAFRLQDKQKVANGLGKALLRTRLQQKYAQPIVARRSRLSSIPVREWMAPRAAVLGPLVANQEGVKAMCRPDQVEALFSSVDAVKNKRQGLAAWQLLYYALWHRIHVEGAAHEGSILEVLDNR